VKAALIVMTALDVLGVGAPAVFVFVVQNVEQPDYATLLRDGPFGLRD
jgi:hypothetical protein